MVRTPVTFIQEMPSESIGARGLVWSMLDALGAFDPGSNPGGPTTYCNFRIASISKIDTAILSASSISNHFASSISSSFGIISSC